MNYAWANPSTGVREQTVPGERLQVAVCRAWKELQDPSCNVTSLRIYSQEPAFHVAPDGTYSEVSNPLPPAPDGWAWADPQNGLRKIAHSDAPLKAILQLVVPAAKAANVALVVVYAQALVTTVQKSDPEPAPSPAPVQATPAPAAFPDLESLKAEFATCWNGDPVLQIVAGALLHIAQSLRILGGVEPKHDAEYYAKYLRSEEVFRPIDKPEEELCTCQGDGKRPDGHWCVCEAGQALKREAAVRMRTKQVV